MCPILLSINFFNIKWNNNSYTLSFTYRYLWTCSSVSGTNLILLLSLHVFLAPEHFQWGKFHLWFYSHSSQVIIHLFWDKLVHFRFKNVLSRLPSLLLYSSFPDHPRPEGTHVTPLSLYWPLLRHLATLGRLPVCLLFSGHGGWHLFSWQRRTQLQFPQQCQGPFISFTMAVRMILKRGSSTRPWNPA